VLISFAVTCLVIMESEVGWKDEWMMGVVALDARPIDTCLPVCLPRLDGGDRDRVESEDQAMYVSRNVCAGLYYNFTTNGALGGIQLAVKTDR
jgi:hypothetical protein